MKVLSLFFPLTCGDYTIKDNFVVYTNSVKVEIQYPHNYCRNFTNKANASFQLDAAGLYQTWV